MKSETGRLPRRLGPFTAIAVVVGVVVGSGIFRVPAVIAANTGSIGGIALVWILGGAISLFGALSIAELSAMYPDSGGLYVYLREIYGKPLAFLAGWMWLLSNPLSWAAQGLVFAEYLATFVPLTTVQTHMVAAVLIAVVAAVNYRSVRLGGAVQDVSTGAKVLAMLAVVLAILLFGRQQEAVLTAPGHLSQQGMAGLGVALVAVLWAYDGWENLTSLAGEVRNPGRNMPLALFGGTAVVIAIYLLMNAAYLHVMSVAEMAHESSVAVAAITPVAGEAGGAIVAAMVMVSIFGSLNGSVMSDSRIFFAMAEDDLFFERIGAVHPRYETPHAAIVLVAAMAIVFVSFRSFAELAEAYVLGVWPFLALSVGGVFILRWRRPDVPRPYRTLGYPAVPLLFLLGTLAVIGDSLYEHPGSTLMSMGLTLAGLPVYFLWRAWKQRVRKRARP
jgi:amino acid transporter